MRQKEKIRKPGTNLLQNKNIMDAEIFFFKFHAEMLCFNQP